MLPNFIVIGAIKGGTTSLYSYFKGHPEIYMSPLKETRYFCFDPEDPEHLAKPFKTFPIRSLEEYRRLFAGVTNEKAIGEASPQYLRSPIAARNINKLLPEVRLIASLRNPVDRAYSEYLMAVRAGNEKRSVDVYFKDEARLRFGCYFEDMKRFFDCFPEDQIKIVLLEHLKDHPEAIVRELFQFLGVDDGYKPDFSAQHNVGGLPKNELLHSVFRIRSKRAKMIFKPLLPKWLLSLRIRAKHANLAPAPPLPEAVRGELYRYFNDDIGKLEDLIGKDLSVWHPG